MIELVSGSEYTTDVGLLLHIQMFPIFETDI